MKALSPSKKPALTVIIIAIVVALVGVGGYAYFANREEVTHPQDTSTIKQEQVAPGSPSQSSLPSKTGETSPDKDPDSQAPADTPPEKPIIERAGGDPTIKVVATFRASSPGHCELQLSKPGQPDLSYTSKIVVSTSYYTCSFTVPRNSLPAGGPWSATVIHHIGAASTRSDTKELE